MIGCQVFAGLWFGAGGCETLWLASESFEVQWLAEAMIGLLWLAGEVSAGSGWRRPSYYVSQGAERQQKTWGPLCSPGEASDEFADLNQ